MKGRLAREVKKRKLMKQVRVVSPQDLEKMELFLFQCRDIGYRSHEELLKQIQELHQNMKVFHLYQVTKSTWYHVGKVSLKLMFSFAGGIQKCRQQTTRGRKAAGQAGNIHSKAKASEKSQI